VVVYKVDHLSRSLLDFARMMETFEQYQVSLTGENVLDLFGGSGSRETPARPH
jgi:16S rRNA G966 N2-methylase RsmD